MEALIKKKVFIFFKKIMNYENYVLQIFFINSLCIDWIEDAVKLGETEQFLMFL